jgi:hypothetical protein
MATCLDQGLVIFKPGRDIKIKLQLQIYFMVNLRNSTVRIRQCELLIGVKTATFYNKMLKS